LHIPILSRFFSTQKQNGLKPAPEVTEKSLKNVAKEGLERAFERF